jgi:hypothetical protein
MWLILDIKLFSKTGVTVGQLSYLAAKLSVLVKLLKIGITTAVLEGSAALEKRIILL